MPAVEAVLFDLYDTLVTADWRSHGALVADRLGVSFEAVDEAYSRLRDERDGGHLGTADAVLAAVAEACGVEAEPALVDKLVEEEAAFLATAVTWYDDSVATLRRLRTAAIKTAVVSNCSPSTLPVTERLGLAEETDAVVLSYLVGVSKPEPGIFRIALDALGVDARAAVFVDDRADYLDGAARLGMATRQIRRDVSFGEDVTGGEHRIITRLGASVSA